MTYTSHFHHIPGSLEGGLKFALRPAPKPCGGVEDCEQCMRESDAYQVEAEKSGFKNIPEAEIEAAKHRHPSMVGRESVNHPSYYGGEDDDYEVIKVIEAWNLDFHLGNTVKYIGRAGKKDPETLVQDLEKAKFYLQRKINNVKAGMDS